DSPKESRSAVSSVFQSSAEGQQSRHGGLKNDSKGHRSPDSAHQIIPYPRNDVFHCRYCCPLLLSRNGSSPKAKLSSHVWSQMDAGFLATSVSSARVNCAGREAPLR